ncbi:MAG: TetR/AcrR family transcriptional regulator [Acidiferrobacteraceae bacterium]
MSDHGEKTRTSIIDSAKRLFYRQGYGNTSFSDIVGSVGIYRGNVYHYFKTKDDILRAVIAVELSEIDALLDHWDASYRDPRDRIGQFVRLFRTNRRDLVRSGCPFGTLSIELGKNRRDLQKVTRKLLDRFREWLEIQFSALGHAQDARSLALHVLVRTQGMSVLAHVYSDSGVVENEVRGLERWIDSIERPARRGRARGQKRS